MTEEDRKVVSDKIAKNGIESLSEEDMMLLPSMGIKFSFSELKTLIDILNSCKTAPWLNPEQKVFVTNLVKDLNKSVNEAVRKVSEYVKNRKHYEDNFEKDKPDPKKEYMEKISGNVGIRTTAPVVLTGRFADEEEQPGKSDLHTDEEIALMNSTDVVEQMWKEYPKTMKAFGDIQREEYELFSFKQADYGPGNIGMNGNLNLSLLALGVRMNDKVQRILHILNKQRNSRKNVWETNNEPLEDSFKDISVYGIIGQIVMDDKWGK